MSKEREISSTFSWKTILSFREEIFGFCALWIFLFHCNNYFGFSNRFMITRVVEKILSVGNTGVDIFLFLSAVGLKTSFERNTIKVYYINRLKRVVLPYLICAIIYYGWYDFIFMKDGIAQYLLNITAVNFWLTGNGLWYVSFILVAYLLYPLLYHLDFKTKHVGLVLIAIGIMLWEIYLMKISNPIIFGYLETAISRIPIFLLSIVWSDFVLHNERVTIRSCISLFVISIPFFLCRYLFLSPPPIVRCCIGGCMAYGE